MNLLGLEVEIGRVAAAVLDAATGAPRGPVSLVTYELDHPTADAVEVPATRLWGAFAAAARQAVAQSGVAARPGEDIAGIGLCTFMPGLVLLGKDDQPLAPIWTYLDRRARPAARQVSAHVGEEFAATTGNRPLPGLISAISWRQHHSAKPYLSHDVHSYLHVNGWLGFHMTGVKAFDPTNASLTGLFNTVADPAWSQRWCDYFEVDRAWLPEVIDADATVGTLRAAIAAELGVPAGIPAKLGTGEIGAMMLAANLSAEDLLYIPGTTETFAVVTERPTPGPRRLTYRLGVGSRFVQLAHNPIGDAALEWIRTLCFQDQSDEEFMSKTIPAARRRATRVSFDPPFLAGDPLEIEAHRAAFRDLELSSERMDLLAAFLREMERRRREALLNLGVSSPIRCLVLAGKASMSLPEIQTDRIETMEDGTLRGIGRLFTQPKF